MKERPILFSAPMVRALLDGRKTQTRRIMKPQPKRDPVFDDVTGLWHEPCMLSSGIDTNPDIEALRPLRHPYGVPGDVLWVKETHRLDVAYDNDRAATLDGKQAVWFEADLTAVGNGVSGKLRPSIFMPRWASRISLRITDVQVERLNEISEEDAKAEGIWSYAMRDDDVPFWHWSKDIEEGDGFSTPSAAYRDLWEHINGKRSWAENPWLWAVTFERV